MKKFLLLSLLFLTTSCVETIVAGTAATGILMAQEKSVGDTKDDVFLTTKIDAEFLKAGLKDPRNKVGVTVDKQRVLLTGLVEHPKIAKVANETAWKVKGVKEVIDEIQVQEGKAKTSNFISYFKDASITAKISSEALVTKGVSSLDFDVETVNGIVYLIGFAKDQDQIKKVTDIAAKTVGVRKVISHITLN